MTTPGHSQDAERRKRFGAAVDEYDRARPGYPGDAVDWCLGHPSDRITVIDVGAGTGKLTRTLLDLGHDVIAVEPDTAMLDRLRNNLGDHPRLVIHSGTAEDLPVSDAAAEAIVAGQAFHWFDLEHAHPEMVRVLADGGCLSAIWNTRDETEPWVAEMSRILGESKSGGATGKNVIDEVVFGPGFTPVESVQYRQIQHLDLETARALALSRSYTIALSETEKDQLLADLESLLRSSFPDGTAPLPYIVECYRAQRL